MNALRNALRLLRFLTKALVEPITRVFRGSKFTKESKQILGDSAVAVTTSSPDNSLRSGAGGTTSRPDHGLPVPLEVATQSLAVGLDPRTSPPTPNPSDHLTPSSAPIPPDPEPHPKAHSSSLSFVGQDLQPIVDAPSPTVPSDDTDVNGVPLPSMEVTDRVDNESNTEGTHKIHPVLLTGPELDSSSPSREDEVNEQAPIAREGSGNLGGVEPPKDTLSLDSSADRSTARGEESSGIEAIPGVEDHILGTNREALVDSTALQVLPNLKEVADPPRFPVSGDGPKSSIAVQDSHSAQESRHPSDGCDKSENAVNSDAGAPAVSKAPKAEEKTFSDVREAPSDLLIPHQYRPTNRGTPPAPRKPQTSTKHANLSQNRALPIAVRILFERGSFCRVSFLPRKTAGLPDEIRVSGSAESAELSALQEGWYQDVVVPDTGRLLREGIEWEGALGGGQRERWSLGGREIYVLAPHPDLSGFVSTARLVLGEDHVVLCTSGRLPEVGRSVALTGSPVPTVLTESSGTPDGWVALRGILPRKPIPHGAEAGDFLDALRPLAEANIVVRGGIRIDRQTWLAGYPPCIRLHGDAAAAGDVMIDGVLSTPDANGVYTAPGWDSTGSHEVWCSSGIRSYSIGEGAEAWPTWAAYSWSLGDLGSDAALMGSAICGGLVLPLHQKPQAFHSTVLPASNPVLLGSIPGQIYRCRIRSDVFAQFCVGFPPFDPVWALPESLRGADKSIHRILFIGNRRPVCVTLPRTPRPVRRGRRARNSVDDWCATVLNASRKHLPVEPPEPGLAELWVEYKVNANAIRKLRK